MLNSYTIAIDTFKAAFMATGPNIVNEVNPQLPTSPPPSFISVQASDYPSCLFYDGAGYLRTQISSPMGCSFFRNFQKLGDVNLGDPKAFKETITFCLDATSPFRPVQHFPNPVLSPRLQLFKTPPK